MLQTFRKPKIILVEDDIDIRSVIEDRLKEYGYDYEAYSNGRTALQAIIESEPSLVILDNFLPGLNGYDILRQVREKKLVPKTKFLILTTSKDPAIVKPLLKLSVNSFVVKPFDIDQLWKRILALLR